MDFTFILAGLIGLALWIAAYTWPGIAFLRDGLGQAEQANRILLILIPGLTITCWSVAIGEALLRMDGVSSLRIVGLPIAGLGICLGLGVCLWSFFANSVPYFLRPNWLLEEDRLGRGAALRRVRQRRRREMSARKSTASLQLKPYYLAGLALGLPYQWRINTAPNPAMPLPGQPRIPVLSVLTADTPKNHPQQARFLVLRVTLPEVSNDFGTRNDFEISDDPEISSGKQRIEQFRNSQKENHNTQAGDKDWQAWVKPLIVTPGWDATEVGRSAIASYPATWALSKRIAGPGMQKRWVVAAGPYLWVFALQVAGEKMGDFEQLGPQILRTVELPTALVAQTETEQ